MKDEELRYRGDERAAAHRVRAGLSNDPVEVGQLLRQVGSSDEIYEVGRAMGLLADFVARCAPWMTDSNDQGLRASLLGSLEQFELRLQELLDDVERAEAVLETQGLEFDSNRREVRRAQSGRRGRRQDLFATRVLRAYEVARIDRDPSEAENSQTLREAIAKALAGQFPESELSPAPRARIWRVINNHLSRER